MTVIGYSCPYFSFFLSYLLQLSLSHSPLSLFPFLCSLLSLPFSSEPPHCPPHSLSHPTKLRLSPVYTTLSSVCWLSRLIFPGYLCDGASDGFPSEPSACWVMLPLLLTVCVCCLCCVTCVELSHTLSRLHLGKSLITKCVCGVSCVCLLSKTVLSKAYGCLDRL